MASGENGSTATVEDPMEKKQVTYTLTAEARRLIKSLTVKKGLSQTAIVETAVREMADREGVASPADPSTRG